MLRRSLLIFFVLVVLTSSVFADAKDPITGDRFEQFLNAQNLSAQAVLEEMFPAEVGCFVTGPLNPFIDFGNDFKAVYSALRVICPNLESSHSAAQKLTDSKMLQRVKAYPSLIERRHVWDVFPRHSFEAYHNDKRLYILIMTTQEVRYLIWLSRVISLSQQPLTKEESRHCHEVAGYLDQIDRDNLDYEAPAADDYGLPVELDLYAPDPDYIIQGYQNYKDFLHSQAEIKTEFIEGVFAFTPTVETIDAMIAAAPQEAYPNKEAEKLQEEY
jgi:hypothetical protein